MKILLILYFLYNMYKTIKNTSVRMNEEKYKKCVRDGADNIEITMARFPAEYQDYLISFSIAISIFLMLVHAVICIYVGIMSNFPIVEIVCGLESVYTIYSALAYWKEVSGVLFERKNIVYHKHEERLSLILSYVCYALVLVSLLAF